jgi:hypothetical protein
MVARPPIAKQSAPKTRKNNDPQQHTSSLLTEPEDDSSIDKGTKDLIVDFTRGL